MALPMIKLYWNMVMEWDSMFETRKYDAITGWINVTYLKQSYNGGSVFVNESDHVG